MPGITAAMARGDEGNAKYKRRGKKRGEKEAGSGKKLSRKDCDRFAPSRPVGSSGRQSERTTKTEEGEEEEPSSRGGGAGMRSGLAVGVRATARTTSGLT